jgi:lipopolysaccharide export system permease protein
VFRQTTGALLLVLISLTGIVWISLALRELNVVTGQGQSAFTLIKMTTLGLPSFVAVITPFALLITAIHTLNRLNSDSEIIVLTASGATAWTITKPLVTLGLIIAVFISLVNHVAMPWSLRLLKEIAMDVRTDLLAQVIQPGRFSSPEVGLTFHIRERRNDGTLMGLIMHDLRDANQAQSYLADRGVIVKDDSGAYLFMMDGHILRREGGIDQPSQIIAFDKYAVDLDSLEQKTAAPLELKARERYSHELFSPDPTEPNFEKEAGRYRSELHERISGAIYPLAFVLMAIAVVGQAQSTRQNRNMRMGLCFLAGVGIRLAGLGINNVVTLNASAVPLLYALPLAAIGISLHLIVRGARPRRPNPTVEKLADALGGFADRTKERFRRSRAPLAGTGASR